MALSLQAPLRHNTQPRPRRLDWPKRPRQDGLQPRAMFLELLSQDGQLRVNLPVALRVPVVAKALATLVAPGSQLDSVRALVAQHGAAAGRIVVAPATAVHLLPLRRGLWTKCTGMARSRHECTTWTR